MAEPVPPADHAARRRIATDLASTLVVEAGAGSGKTTALVGRVLALVTSGRAELRSIAAITFTDKAGAELRDRVRQELERHVSDLGGDRARADVAARCRTALEQLDGAAIGTLHSFAQRLLSEHPVEAGLPPRVEVLDEVSSNVAFERRWAAFREELLAEPTLQRSILLLMACGVRHEALRVLASAFDDNWDLVAERVQADEHEPPSVHLLVRPAFGLIAEVCAERCNDPDDRLRRRLDDIAQRTAELHDMSDELDLLEAIGPRAVSPLPSFKVGNVGRQSSFDNDVALIRARVRAAGDQLEDIRSQIANACARRLASAVRGFTLGAARERQRAGELEFHDLLVLARALLSDTVHGAAVRVSLHERYRHLLLDEFQDTDPIQIELAVRIAADDPRGSLAARAQWIEVPVTPGQLFIVGDPKQSIYRFRRADVATFMAAVECFGTEAGGAVELTANFRTVAPILDWINTTFGSLMGEADHVPVPVASQPRFVALQATRPAHGLDPPVSVIGRRPHSAETKADELRTAEAQDVAATVARAVREGWAVYDGDGWRPARLGDVTVLVPSRTSLPFLEDALDRAGLAYRAESSSLVYTSRAVRDLLTVLGAVDDPTNDLLIVSALRTSLLGCGDDDLFRFKSDRGGHWSYLADQPDSVVEDDPVRVGLEYLRELHEVRHWLAPSELLERIAGDRRAYELGFAEGRPRDVWRRLRFVVDQARAWTEATGGNLREYLRWVRQQTAEGARVAEAVLPETDDDAVRIMTIHSAKGLEFPITVVSGMSTVPTGRPAAAQVVFPPTGGVGYRFGASVATDDFVAWAPIDEQMSHHERVRLLYVACTRARDHLVVSVHRKARVNPPSSIARTNAELLVAGMGDLLDEVPDAATPLDERAVPRPVAPTAPMPFAQWEVERTAALVAASRSTTVAATALTEEGALDSEGHPDPGLEKRPRDLDLPPWLKGRYGTAVGRAVHGVLQSIDLVGAAGLDAVVAAQCEAEAVTDRAQAVRHLVVDALASPSVREAAGHAHWREVYACTPVGGRLLEGYVDLLFRGDEGLVVVDYKTSATSDPHELERRLVGYRLQGASYALAVAAATGERVARVTFVFLTPDGAREMHLPDLAQGVADVGALVASGGEVTVG